MNIYIPHWLDSMEIRGNKYNPLWYNLHSTLVRFYGLQVLDALQAVLHLHSTLVRFYVLKPCRYVLLCRFTFHTG